MARPSHLQQLNEAVKIERSEDELRQRRCDDFLEKVIWFQSGKGALPAEFEFLQFREDLMRVAAVRMLSAGAAPGVSDTIYTADTANSSQLNDVSLPGMLLKK